MAYGEVARTLALRLKYGGRMAFADTIARQMVRVIPADTDLLVPVPLHRWRIWNRGFNQAALIADALGWHRGVAVDRALLHRTRATPALRGLGRKARRKAVSGAFSLSDNAQDRLKGRSIGLVDDVYTSGATTDACVRLLKRAGASRVAILTWARVLGDAED
ncbi:ComF family protein [Sphingomonadaceae bacterium LXI357]|uniref:ComF family protein n=1 Tax=Stakelama marina TaxID=2826939 RepID=A0A8T4IC81_9SPHN|nr:ComF family protein [Stakelama marina]